MATTLVLYAVTEGGDRKHLHHRPVKPGETVDLRGEAQRTMDRRAAAQDKLEWDITHVDSERTVKVEAILLADGTLVQSAEAHR